MKIQMLGTGNAMVTNCYNTCFMMEHQGEYLLVDAGGGNQILKKFKEMQIPFDRFHHMIVTHAHTDHILGVIWVIRQMATLMRKEPMRVILPFIVIRVLQIFCPACAKRFWQKGRQNI